MSDMRQVDEEGVHMNDAEGRVLLCVARSVVADRAATSPSVSSVYTSCA